jgi:hypothetical protein
MDEFIGRERLRHTVSVGSSFPRNRAHG